MAAKTLHFVQAFLETEDGVMAVPPKTFLSASVAKAVAKILAHSHLGVVAWSRAFEPDAGDYELEEIVRLGAIPEWFDEGGGVE